VSLDAGLQRLWYGPAWLALPLWPLALLFRSVVALRAAAYRLGILRAHEVGRPVIVVGNLTVGGTGKTPVAAWLAHALSQRGYRVGVVLRGYGGSYGGRPRLVQSSDNPADVGDEALVHARRDVHVVVIGADRVAAARHAVEHGAEVVVCDDGLQHRRLARDYEIAVVDGVRGLGNGLPLPAGPLREPAHRLESVNAVVITYRAARGTAPPLEVRTPLLVDAHFSLDSAVNLVSGERRPLQAFGDAQSLHALAAIGHPDAFFRALRDAGLRPVEHALPDHAALDPQALPFPPDVTVLMTEKDAVKCREFGQPGWWWVDLEVAIDRTDAETLLASIHERTGLAGAGAVLG
jgi:tetraacyldisaccharide 4'-kinase